MANLNAAGEGKRRVKLYALNDERNWEDQGTGHIYWIIDINQQHYVSLVVKSETDGSILLDSKILLSSNYQKQQDTLIVWSDVDKRDLALSFQEKAGCDEIWGKICEVVGKDPNILSQNSGNDTFAESDEDQLDNDINSSSSNILPPCELGRLKEIRDFFVNELVQKSNNYKEKLAAVIESNNYIRRLIELFHVSEDLDNVEGLNYLFEIFRSIFYLNKSSLFDILLSDDLIMEVVGCLEYDPSKSEPVKHREYISTRAQFKEVIPFDNSDLVNKIHQTYRIQYIQDVIFPAPSVFEENSLSSLTSFIFLNKVEISNRIQEDERFLNELFENLKNPELDLEKRRDLFQFLREFINFSHSLQQSREVLYQSLYNYGILSVIENALTIDDEKVNTIAIEIFSQFVEVAPTLVREFILKEVENKFTVPNSLNVKPWFTKQPATPSTPVLPFSTTANNSTTSTTTTTITTANTNSNNSLNVINNNNNNSFQTPVSSKDTLTVDQLSVAKTNKIPNKSISLSSILNIDQEFEPVLINYVIKHMINDPDEELSGAMQIVNLFKLLIDPENMLSAANAEKSEFLSFFYKKSMPVLLTPLMSNTANNKIARDDYRLAQLENLILDFLSFCVEHHTYHIKNYIIHRDLLKRILVLLNSKHQFLALSALRFLRKTVSLKEDCYFKHIIKANLFAPVVEALKTNGSRYNILNSAIIELFDFIRSEDIKSLMTYIIESFYDDLADLNYVKTFKELKIRYDQLKEKQFDSLSRSRLSNEGTPALYRTRSTSDRYRQSNTDMDDYVKENDAWFEEEDDEFENRYDASNAATSGSGLALSGSSSSSNSNSSNGSNGNNNNEDNSENNSQELSNENNLETFIEYKKSNLINMDDGEDTLFSPVKSVSSSSTSSSSSSSSASNQHQQASGATAFKSINIKITNATSILLNNKVKSGDSSLGKEQSHSPSSAYYDNENNMISSPSGSSNSSTPTHSPSSASKKALVDYEYDSDDDDANGEATNGKTNTSSSSTDDYAGNNNLNQEESKEECNNNNNNNEDEENIIEPSAKRLAMSTSPLTESNASESNRAADLKHLNPLDKDASSLAASAEQLVNECCDPIGGELKENSKTLFNNLNENNELEESNNKNRESILLKANHGRTSSTTISTINEVNNKSNCSSHDINSNNSVNNTTTTTIINENNNEEANYKSSNNNNHNSNNYYNNNSNNHTNHANDDNIQNDNHKNNVNHRHLNNNNNNNNSSSNQNSNISDYLNGQSDENVENSEESKNCVVVVNNVKQVNCIETNAALNNNNNNTSPTSQLASESPIRGDTPSAAELKLTARLQQQQQQFKEEDLESAKEESTLVNPIEPANKRARLSNS